MLGRYNKSFVVFLSPPTTEKLEIGDLAKELYYGNLMPRIMKHTLVHTYRYTVEAPTNDLMSKLEEGDLNQHICSFSP